MIWLSRPFTQANQEILLDNGWQEFRKKLGIRKGKPMRGRPILPCISIVHIINKQSYEIYFRALNDNSAAPLIQED